MESSSEIPSSDPSNFSSSDPHPGTPYVQNHRFPLTDLASLAQANGIDINVLQALQSLVPYSQEPAAAHPALAMVCFLSPQVFPA